MTNGVICRSVTISQCAIIMIGCCNLFGIVCSVLFRCIISNYEPQTVYGSFKCICKSSHEIEMKISVRVFAQGDRHRCTAAATPPENPTPHEASPLVDRRTVERLAAIGRACQMRSKTKGFDGVWVLKHVLCTHGCIRWIESCQWSHPRCQLPMAICFVRKGKRFR